jgi:carboxymethylenebutenolidase
LAKLGRGKGKTDLIVVPKGASGAVVVFHEVWGLVEHTKDVCKRIGKLGFAATAPNLYEGYDKLLTPDNIQKAMKAVWELSLEERRDKSKLEAVLAKKRPEREVVEAATTLYDQGFRDRILAAAVDVVEGAHAKFGRASTLGFSFGGGVSLRVATMTKNLESAIAYYAEPPKGDDIRKISSPVLAIYAGGDEFINQYITSFVEAATEAGTDLTFRILPGAKHGFFDNTKRATYNKEAAAEAWSLTSWFLQKTLG